MGFLLLLSLFSLCESARVAVSDRSTRDCPYKNFGGPCPSCASPITAPPGVAPLIDPWKVPVDPDEYAQSIRAASDRACPVEFSRDDDFSGGGERISGVQYWVVSPNATVTNPSYGFQYASASRKRAMWEQTFQKSLLNPRQAAEYLEVGVLADGLLTDCTLHVYNVTGTQQSFCVQASSLIPWWFYIYNETARATDNVTSEYLGILQFDRSDPQQRFYEDAPGGYDVYMFRGAWFPRKLDFLVFQFVNRVTQRDEVQLYHQRGTNFFWDYSELRVSAQQAAHNFFCNTPLFLSNQWVWDSVPRQCIRLDKPNEQCIQSIPSDKGRFDPNPPLPGCEKTPDRQSDIPMSKFGKMLMK